MESCSSKEDGNGSISSNETGGTERSIKEIALSFQEKLKQKVNLEEMKVKLSRLSSQYGGLLSPEFFLNSPEASTADTPTHFKLPSNKCSTVGGNNIAFATENESETTHFSFPNTAAESYIGNSESAADELIHKLERVEILEDDADDTKESEWEECHENYIQTNNYCLGIQPGKFYKNKAHSFTCVELPHRANYEVLVTNNNRSLCNLDLYVNGKPTNALVLPPGETKAIDGPAYSKYAFKIFRSNCVPAGKNVDERNLGNGTVKAVFTPKREEVRLRSFSEPFHSKQTMTDLSSMLDGLEEEKKPRSFSNDGDHLERSFDVSKVIAGLTLLQGQKKKRRYIPAPELDVDTSRRVVLQLKLFASLVEEVNATEDDIHIIEPPEPDSEEED